MTSILRDKIFISTRPQDKNDELTALLAGEGAQVVEFPLIEIKPAEIPPEAEIYFRNSDQFQWIIFTSANGVKYFFEKLIAVTGTHNLKNTIQLAVIGKKTEQVLQSYGYYASFVNPGSTAEDFAGPFLNHIKKEIFRPNVFLPLGNLARSVIQDQLKQVANCIRADVYKTESAESYDPKIIKQIKEDNYDMIIFTSPSGVRSFKNVMPDSPHKNIRMACIGAVTRLEALQNGYHPLATAQNSSSEGMVESIINYYISKKIKNHTP